MGEHQLNMNIRKPYIKTRNNFKLRRYPNFLIYPLAN